MRKHQKIQGRSGSYVSCCVTVLAWLPETFAWLPETLAWLPDTLLEWYVRGCLLLLPADTSHYLYNNKTCARPHCTVEQN